MGKPFRVVLVGISGRMGMELIAAAKRSQATDSPLEIVGGIVAANDPFLGKELPGVNFPAVDSWQDEFSEAQVIIDFSSPRGAVYAAECAAKFGLPLVCCSTGLSEEDEELIAKAGLDVPVVRTRNTSVGITVMKELVAKAAKLLGESFDTEVMEIHHRHKQDAPSGTAYILLEEAAAAKGEVLKERLVAGRFGGEAKRQSGDIGVCALRGGDVAGEHTVYFFGEGERIELSHKASSRRIFADGAFRAARWLAADGIRPPGMYQMLDVLSQ